MSTAHRAGLPPMPAGIAALPVDPRGYPVPWFVQWFKDGEPTDPGVGVPDFRVVDGRKMKLAITQHRCWLCGQQLQRGLLAFVVGPMCAVNRTSGEPPAHRACAIFSVLACPFLTMPKAQRREAQLPGGSQMSPSGLRRNPGVALVWLTETFKEFRGTANEPLFEMGAPRGCLWYAEGREATREEVLASIDSGLPALLKIAADYDGADAVVELQRRTQFVRRELVPA